MKQLSNNYSNSHIILILLILLIIILAYQYDSIPRKDNMTNVIPYIAQAVFINIYATPEDYPIYQWSFKANLNNNIRVTNGKDYVFVPKTIVNIPVNVFNNAPKTMFTITANGIEQYINLCDFIATTF
jgi:hypothetical protein